MDVFAERVRATAKKLSILFWKKVRQRTRLAVQGLLEEIDELVKWYEENRKRNYHIFTAKRDTAWRIKTKIKKWFLVDEKMKNKSEPLDLEARESW